MIPESGIESLTGRLDYVKYKAAKFWGYEVDKFCEQLSTHWQAELIAAYIVDCHAEAVIAMSARENKP